MSESEIRLRIVFAILPAEPVRTRIDFTPAFRAVCTSVVVSPMNQDCFKSMFKSATADLDHAGFWLAAIAIDLQVQPFAGKSLLGMMRAQINAIEKGVFASEQGFELVMDVLQFGSVQKPLATTG